jgi:hypothetical protein
MQKRDAGVPEVDAVYQREMGMTEEFLALSFFHRGFQSFGNGFQSTTYQRSFWDFLAEKKTSSVLFPLPTPKTPHALIHSVYLPMR